ncbi:MAG: YraN family protein [Arenimonas sp.]|nr:YraN family protein [Arenimonas sp.]
MSASPTFRQVRGRMAEDAALAFLAARGLQLLERNARFSVGELDLILLHGDTLVFAEVRQRKSEAFGGAAQSIDARKRRKCALAAQCWLKRNPRLADAPCRFDAVLLTGTEDDWRIEWIQGAFVFEDVF